MEPTQEQVAESAQAARYRKRRQGQTLAEFALTLPILLLLLFGIIEFGRILQAVVTLQNAARTAARYATTGQYDEARYQMNLEYVSVGTGDFDSIVPCVALPPGGDETDILGQIGGAPQTILIDDKNVSLFWGGHESIYATYYGDQNIGSFDEIQDEDCDPIDPEDQNRRRDLARILSVFDEAREGAVGLALGANSLNFPLQPLSNLPAPLLYSNVITNPYGGATPTLADVAKVPWYTMWFRPLPATVCAAIGSCVTFNERQPRLSNEAGWFDLMLCSTRSESDQQGLNANQRKFDTLFDPAATSLDAYAPACLMADDQAPNTNPNNDFPWLDAGGPGDTVNLVVSFNHPLITPLGLGAYVRLEARRVAINEAFRSPNAGPLSSGLGNSIDTSTPIPATPSNTPITPTATDTPVTPTATDTPNPTPTYTDTIGPSPTATQTPTNLPVTATLTATTVPFDCSVLSISAVNFLTVGTGGDVEVIINYAYAIPTQVTRATINWDKSAMPLYPSAAVTQMLILGVAWSGNDQTSNTDVGNAASEFPTWNGPSSRAINTGSNTFVYNFNNAPSNVAPFVTQIEVYIDDPTSPTDCRLSPPLTPPPVPTLSCGGTVAITNQTTGNSSFGKRYATLTIVNNQTVPVTITGFTLAWITNPGPPPRLLREVWMGGSGPTTGQGSTQIWQALTGQSPTSPVVSTNAAQGSYLTTFTINPGVSTFMHVVIQNWAAAAVNVAGTSVTFNAPACGTTPTSVFTVVPPTLFTPSPTFTNTATNTPTNTLTPTVTNTATNTLTATNTATNTLTPTPTWTGTNTPVTPTRTNTPVTPTRTNTPVTPTLTFTPVTPTLTFTPITPTPVTPTRTNTPVTPTLTFTPVTPTLSPTATPVTPTRTNTPVTPTRTNTPVTPTRTNTPVTPTLTFTPVTPTATPTNTPVTPTLTFTPVTPTATRTNTPITPTATPTNTEVPDCGGEACPS